MTGEKYPNIPNISQKIWDIINSINSHIEAFSCVYNPNSIQYPNIPTIFIRSMGERINNRNRGNNVFQKGLYGFLDFLGYFSQNGLKLTKGLRQ